jgi:hypothetical protein
MDRENPHDRFAKTVMSKIENAKDFFQGVLPKGLKRVIDIETLRHDPDSYVDEELSEFISDIVFICRCRESLVKLAVLFEHKSFVPAYPHFQLLRYNLNIWNRHIRNRRKPPMVLPVVLYHGRKKWKKQKLAEYFTGPGEMSGTSSARCAAAFNSFVPEFDYILVNLSAYQHTEIEKRLFRRMEVKIWLLLQKYIYETDKLLRHLNSILGIDILYFRDEEGLRFLRTALLYIEISSGLTINEVAKAMEHTDPVIREEYMTLYEQTIQVGKITEKQEVLIRLLTKKFGLTEEEKAYIKSIKDAEILEKGLDEILFADSKEKVLAVLQ